MAKKMKDFSPVADRIYLAVKRGITARTNPSQVKRIIDAEFDKFKGSASASKIKKEVDKALKTANANHKKEVEALQKTIKDLESKIPKATPTP